MDLLLALLACPLAGALVLGAVGERRWAPEANVAFSLGTFLAAAALVAQVIAAGPRFALGREFFLDPLNVFLVALTAFVAFTTALFSRPYMRVEQEHGRMTPKRLRLYHSMYQLFSFTMLLALTTNNMGFLWVATEAATLATVLLVSVYRTAASLEAAWKYFILCGVGIAQALFGTVLLYMAAERAGAGPEVALHWTELETIKASLDPRIMGLAFAFLFVGYGTKVGLVPVHNWLPDAHAEGPTPVSAVLSGLLLNVALYAVLRCKVLTDGALGTALAGQLMMFFGLASVLVAAFFLSRQRDVKRMFAYSSIEHMGLITFAFGVGGAVATFAGLLHMTVHSLVKSAIFFAVGHAAQKSGTLKSIRAFILLDMIGDRSLTIRRESNSTGWLTDIVWGVAKKLGHRAFMDEETTVEDDHIPFVKAGVPSLDIIDLDYPQWHTAQDTLDAVGARSLQVVGDVVVAALPVIEARLLKN